MENSGEDCVLSCDTIVLKNCVTLKSSGIHEGDLMVQESAMNELFMEICNEDSLIRTTVIFEEDAFQFYNGHAFKLGFSIRKGRKRYRASSVIIYMRQFNCHKEGKKFDKGKVEKCYTKVDIPTNCKAMIEFFLNNDGGWTVSRNISGHNHDLCLVNQRHLMHSQKAVTKNHAGYLQELKDSGVSIAASLRVLKKQEQQEYGRFPLPPRMCLDGAPQLETIAAR
ncbi:hypothetical protein M9H77_03239 [Catharanthus roseus]|uniref:Uncharacterized protein n=1 Tax=Catharanthus roseus TaxID=4058 RepID=A0ACC0CAQ1_CATRO|nr:hypothetical protein M9H77_03239 [Catharanthus roseus]